MDLFRHNECGDLHIPEGYLGVEIEHWCFFGTLLVDPANWVADVGHQNWKWLVM